MQEKISNRKKTGQWKGAAKFVPQFGACAEGLRVEQCLSLPGEG